MRESLQEPLLKGSNPPSRTLFENTKNHEAVVKFNSKLEKNSNSSPVEKKEECDDDDESDEEAFFVTIRQGAKKSKSSDNPESTMDSFVADFKEKSRIGIILFGVKFAASKEFWCRTLPLVVLTGILTGAFSITYFLTYGEIYKAFFHRQDTDKDGGLSIGEVSYNSGEWWWILLGVLGSILSKVCLLLPGAPSRRKERSVFHFAVELEGDGTEALYSLASILISCSFGGSVGFESALMTIGGFVAYFVSRLHRNERYKKLLVFCGAAAAIGGILPVPALGVLLVHELSCVSRAGDTTFHE